MKTLILNGSPRINGDTASLISLVAKDLSGEYRIIDAYRCMAVPCTDCRYCRENDGCAVMDEMQEVYRYINICDNILIVSPVYFSELTGKLLDIGSRLQAYYCARRFRKKELTEKHKKGAVILVGGGDGNLCKAYETACVLLRQMNCKNIHPLVFSHKTDIIPAVNDRACCNGVKDITVFFNGLHSRE